MGALKDFDVTKARREQAAFGVAVHNTVRTGLNYAGRCDNAACRVHGLQVVSPRGCGVIVVNDDIALEKAKCPVCSRPFRLATIVLFECRATATLLRHAEEKTTYEADGSNLVILGSNRPAGGGSSASAAAVVPTDALLTMDVKGRSGGEGCVVA